MKTIMSETTYKIWSNDETKAVFGFIDWIAGYDEYLLREAAKHIRAARMCSQVKEGIWTVEEAAMPNLAAQLKEELDSGEPLLTPCREISVAEISNVNWNELARYWLSNTPESNEPSSDLFGPVTFAYARAQAIADGVLIDVSWPAWQSR